MTMINRFLIATPSLAIFICLLFGYILGKLKYHTFTIGSTVGVLVIGLLIGQVGEFNIAPVVKNVFFDLFIFTIGFEVGPSFVASLKKSGFKIMIQSLFFGMVAFVVAFVCLKLFKVNPGTGAGIVAGALTQSATIGTADAAIMNLDLNTAVKHTLTTQTAVAYALTYVFGTAGVVLFLKNIAPYLLGINLRDETKRMIDKLRFSGDAAHTPAIMAQMRIRSFMVGSDAQIIGMTIRNLERRFKDRISVEGLLKHEIPIAYNNATRIEAGQILTIVGNVAEFIAMTKAEPNISETFELSHVTIDVQNMPVILTRVYHASELLQLADNDILINQVMRNGQVIANYSTLKVGDIVTLFGPKRAIAKCLPDLGYVESSGSETDIPFLALGLVVGIALGMLTITIGEVPLTLGTGGGVLFIGLFMGWYQNRHRHFGEIPAATRWFFKSVGLNLFIAVVGLDAGYAFIPALKSMGWEVLLIGALISILPHLISLYFGKYILKMDTVSNIGALCGVGTVTAALNAISEETDSSIFALGYTPGYAIGNIILTIMGPLIVALLA